MTISFLYDIPVVFNGLVVALNDGVVICLSLSTGERLWEEDMPAGGVTTVVDDYLVIWCNGEIRLAMATNKAYGEVALIKTLDAEEPDACTTPSYANSHFYLRNSSKIAAVKVSK